MLDIIIKEKSELTKPKDKKITIETENKITETEETISDIFVKEDINDKYKKLNKTKLSKMKIAELLELSGQLNIKFVKKPKKMIL
jgi:hypothetical protein